MEETSEYKDINSLTNINIYICIKYYYSIDLFPKYNLESEKEIVKIHL